jgi:hypothetical protein
MIPCNNCKHRQHIMVLETENPRDILGNLCAVKKETRIGILHKLWVWLMGCEWYGK